MSVTFSIEGIEEETGYELPCEVCGRKLGHDDAMADCSACYGFGGPSNMPQPRFVLNIANGNAMDLLEYLGLYCDYAGSIDPGLLDEKLREFPPNEFEAPNRQLKANVTQCGRTKDQVDRYWRVLRRICKQAKKYSRKVVWS